MPYPTSGVPRVTVGGVIRTVGILGLDTGKDYYWAEGSTTITQDPSETILTSSDSLEVYYPYISTYVGYNKLDAEIAARKAIEGGTGEYWIHKTLSGVHTKEEIDAYIPADLARFARISEVISYESDNPTIRAGRVQAVNIAQHGCAGNYLITGVNIQDVDATLLRRTITAQLGAYLSQPIDFFKALVKK